MSISDKRRLSRGGCVLFAATLCGPSVQAGVPVSTAYFSFEGEFVAGGDRHDFLFDLSRPVGGGEDLRFVTYANGGGTNGAGDTIAPGGIDSTLELFDSLDASRGFNDDSGGLDSLLTWPTLNPDPLTAGSYRLRLQECCTVEDPGVWAVDLIGPADAITLTGATPTGTSRIDSLKFGTDFGGGPAATFNQAGTLSINNNLTVAPTGDAVFNNSGNTTVKGVTTLNAGGTLTQTAGLLFTDTVNLNGGTLDIQGGVWSVNTLTGLTTLDVDGFMNIGDTTAGTSAASLAVGAGQSLDVLGTFSVGEFGKAGTLTISDGGTVTAQATARIGAFGGTAGSAINVNAGGLLDVGGTLQLGGSFAGVGGASTLTVGGANARAEIGGDLAIFSGSSLDNTSGGVTEVAGNTDVNGTLNVSDWFFRVGGTLDLMPGGAINLTGSGTIQADTLALTGGAYNNPSPTTVLAINRMQNFGTLNQSGFFTVGDTQAGASTSSVVIGNGESITVGNATAVGFNKPGHVTVNSGGQLIAQSDARIGTFAGSSGSSVTVNAGGLFDVSGGLLVGGLDAGTLAASTVTIDGAAAEAQVDGTLTILAGSTVTQTNGGVLDADGDISIQGGTLNLEAPTFQWTGGNTMTVSNGGQVSASGGQWNIYSGNTINVTDGNLTQTGGGFLSIGNTSAGTVTINGANASMNVSGAQTDVSNAGSTGTLSFLNGATGTLGQLDVGRSNTTATTDGTVNVLSGSSLSTDHITVGNLIGNMGAGTVNVTGVGSSITQVGSSGLQLGNVNPLNLVSDHTLNVTQSGAFTTGNGVSRIEKSGTLNIETGGAFNVNGTLNLNAGGTLNVHTGGQLNINVAALNINAAANFDAAGGTVFVDANGTLNASGLTVANFGTLRLENSGTANLPHITRVDVLIQDDGVLNPSLSPSSSFFVNHVDAFDTATFNGFFTLGANTAGPSAASMVLGTGDVLTVHEVTTVALNKAASLSVNDGTFNAGGGLIIGGTSAGTVTVNDGLLHAGPQSGSIPDSPLTITVGQPTLATGNTLLIHGGQVLSDGHILVSPGNSFTMTGGELETDLFFSEGTLNISDGGLTLNGLTATSSAGIGTLSLGNASLTIGSTRGPGYDGLGPLVLVSAGESLAARYIDVGINVGATLEVTGGGTVNTTASSDVGDGSNGGSAGTVNITGVGSVWNVGGGGLNIDRGTVTLGDGGSIVTTGASGSVDIFEAGVLRGNGSITVNDELYNEGTLILDSVTDAPVIADLEIFGNYTQDTDGTIEVGTVSGSENFMEQLRVHDGLITLAGELAFDPAADYSTLLQYNTNIGPIILGVDTATRVGVFNTVTGGDLGDGTGLAIIYGSARVDIMRAIAGDLNFDGFVGIADLNIVLGNWNQNVTAGVWGLGDPTGDGFIGIADLNIVLGNWNNGTPPADVATLIPEPGAGVMLLVSGLFAAGGCRRGGHGGMI